MQTREGYLLRDVAGAPVVVATGKAAEQFLGMMNLNKTGAFFWKLLEKGATEEELVEKALEQLNFMVCRRECVCLKARIMDFQEMESRFTECAV